MKSDETLYKIALGKNIKKIRKKANLTQDAFSEKIGIEPSSLSNIENGKSFPSALTIIQIQQQFKISTDEIFDVEFLVKDISLIEKDIEKRVKSLDSDKKRALWNILRTLDF